jgi:hypothetical protein
MVSGVERSLLGGANRAHEVSAAEMKAASMTQAKPKLVSIDGGAGPGAREADPDLQDLIATFREVFCPDKSVEQIKREFEARWTEKLDARSRAADDIPTADE